MVGDRHLEAVDTALVRLRRLWTPQRQVQDGDVPIDLSSVLVAEGCARGAAAGEDVTVGSIAVFADVEHSTASRLVERAVRAGLVVRTRSTQDARRATLALTPAGIALRERAVRFRMDWLARTLSSWSQTDVVTFAALLTRFADTVAGEGGPGRQPAPERVDAPPGDQDRPPDV